MVFIHGPKPVTELKGKLFQSASFNINFSTIQYIDLAKINEGLKMRENSLKIVTFPTINCKFALQLELIGT